jgi:hypothetical protein
MFVVNVAWWRRHRRRFRDYVLGEACWDNVYAAILMVHSNGLVLNRDPLILHEVHETAWHDQSAAARYNGMLAALDSRYFSLWSHYWHRLDAARSSGQAVDEAALCRDAFAWRRSLPAALRQAVRNLRARYRFARSTVGAPGA